MYEEHSGRFVQKKFAAGIQIPDGVGFMMYTELRDWTEWQERCALGLCAEATAKRLVSYGVGNSGIPDSTELNPFASGAAGEARAELVIEHRPLSYPQGILALSSSAAN